MCTSFSDLYKVKNKRRKDSGLQLELEGVRKLQDRMRKEMSDGFYFGQLFANVNNSLSL